jgi:hypothetical protein
VRLASPDSDSYKAVKKAVLADADPDGNAHTRRYLRANVPMSRRADRVQDELEEIMRRIKDLLEKVCGEDQAACSWEVAMKAYILSFP